MPLILPSNSISAGGYDVANSLRFNGGSSDYLNRTNVASPTNQFKWTFSFWVKLSDITDAQGSGNQMILSDFTDASNRGTIFFEADDTLVISDRVSGSFTHKYITNRLFRDVSAWYHIVVNHDRTLASPATKVFVNGVQETSFGTSTDPSQNGTSYFNKGGQGSLVGKYGGGSEYYNGYLSEAVWIDGQVLDADQFGEFDEDSPTIWKPKDVSGLTFGTNGFYLDFENSGSLGADVSGNGNNFTVNNLTSIDQSTDTCTNNFCTNNSIAPDTTGSDTHAFSNGNLVITTASNGWWNTFGTIGITTGKWYYEYLTTGSGSVDQMVGFVKSNFYRGSNAGIDVAGCYSLYAGSAGNGTLFTNSATGVDMGTSWAWTFDDIVMVAIDASSGKIWYGKNGTWFGSGNPATGANEAQTVISADLDYGLLPAFSGYHSGATALMNFGSPSFAISSGNSDGNGFGQFEYQPPSGYLALCTKNLATDG